MPRAAFLAGAILLGTAACGAEPHERPATTAWSAASVVPATGDSAVPADPGYESAVQRFRAGVPRPSALTDGAPSADSLVRQFVAALERADTLALIRLHVSRAEFAWLVHPESRHAHPPYRQRPEVTWLLVSERSNSGLARLLSRRGGRPLGFAGHACPDAGEVEGRNRYHGRCVVFRRGARGDTIAERLFGSIIERDGRYKIASYSNQF